MSNGMPPEINTRCFGAHSGPKTESIRRRRSPFSARLRAAYAQHFPRGVFDGPQAGIGHTAALELQCQRLFQDHGHCPRHGRGTTHLADRARHRRMVTREVDASDGQADGTHSVRGRNGVEERGRGVNRRLFAAGADEPCDRWQSLRSALAPRR